jgi:enterochelin esterase-like enzyme
MIVVMPDANTKFKGAMYGASITTGDFPRYVATDLVGYIDGHYRTIANPASRGLSGHSMGGFGTLKIAMMYPGVFSSIYAMAPCCLSPSNMTAEQLAGAFRLHAREDCHCARVRPRRPAQLAAWAPDPQNPPLLRLGGRQGRRGRSTAAGARLHANSPMVMLPQYVPAMKALEAIRVEVGDKDFLLNDDTQMHQELDRFGVAHEWKVFEGDHGNRVHDRVRTELLPFFGAHLDK